MQYAIALSKKEIQSIIEACFYAVEHERGFIAVYADVHDGSEKEPIKKSTARIKKWKKLEKKFEAVIKKSH